MTYSINDTTEYHIHGMETLGWELTVCNSLEPPDSPLRKILVKDMTFGTHLYDFLDARIDLGSVGNLLEAGGGYGFVMRDFLIKNSGLSPAMVDISPYLLEQQKNILTGNKTRFIQNDFFRCDAGFLKEFDLIMLNEVAGDFPAVSNLRASDITRAGKDPVLKRIRDLYSIYGFPLNEDEEFTFNLGAVEAVDRLCSLGTRYIYLSEHSCEGSTGGAYSDIVRVSFPGIPEKIRLRGHNEYTVKFSHLQRVAMKHGYKTIRGNYTDLIPVRESPKIRFILTSQTQNDEHEIIRHFVEDLYKYEYLILIRD